MQTNRFDTETKHSGMRLMQAHVNLMHSHLNLNYSHSQSEKMRDNTNILTCN
jgi:hypothetical protein